MDRKAKIENIKPKSLCTAKEKKKKKTARISNLLNGRKYFQKIHVIISKIYKELLQLN